MQKLLVMIFLVALAGCGCTEAPSPGTSTEWKTAITDYRCSLEQTTKVHLETEFCAKTTSYRNEFCYATALMRNCEKANAVHTQ